MLADVLKKFCNRETLPVNVSEVETAIRHLIKVDQINFYPRSAMNPQLLRGMVEIYTAYEGTPTSMETVDIYYASSMDADWQRVVQTKELVHLFDSDGGLAGDEGSILKLITELVTPHELSAVSNPTKEDHYALSWALAFLFPRKCMELFSQPLTEGKITFSEIASIAKIPPRFMPFLFSDIFRNWINALLEEDGN